MAWHSAGTYRIAGFVEQAEITTDRVEGSRQMNKEPRLRVMRQNKIKPPFEMSEPARILHVICQAHEIMLFSGEIEL